MKGPWLQFQIKVLSHFVWNFASQVSIVLVTLFRASTKALGSM